MKKNMILAIIFGWSVIILESCSLFDLELQRPYDYDTSPIMTNQLETGGWGFITSRTDLFARFIEAVQYAGIDTAEFNQAGIAIFPFTNEAIERDPDLGNYTNRFPGGYWYKHPVNDIKPDRWEAYPKEQVKQLVLNHIMKYAISYHEFLEATRGARTFFPTKATNGYGYISLHMLNSTETQNGTEAITFWVNDFPSHYKKDNPAVTGYGMYISPRTSNLRTNNGSYIHVMDYFLDYPTEDDLKTVPIYNK